MPWKASSVMEERLRFVARLLDGEAMTDVCREFGISRKTGYKIFDRYKEHGLEALSDRSRRPVRYANQLPQQVETLIVRLKSEKPHWGARKIRELLPMSQVRSVTYVSGPDMGKGGSAPVTRTPDKRTRQEGTAASARRGKDLQRVSATRRQRKP
jgi:transposase